MKDQSYRFSLGADAGARDVVFRQLEHFNLQQVGDLIYEDFQLYARNASDEVVGGMFGHSGLGWLYIDYFWVQDDQRSKGLASSCSGRPKNWRWPGVAAAYSCIPTASRRRASTASRATS